MVYRKGELSLAQVDWDWPHRVTVAESTNGSGRIGRPWIADVPVVAALACAEMLPILPGAARK